MAEVTKIELRASSLPSATDCWRKWAVSNDTFRPILAKHGFDFARRDNNIGATIGTACHDGIGQFLQGKVDGYDVDPEYAALNKFRRLTESEMPVDKATPNAKVAELQIRRQLAEIMPKIRELKPKKIEFKLEAVLDPIKNYVMTGHPDLYDESSDYHDWKFGAHLAPYAAQLGAYRLMGRSFGMEANKLFAWWTPRVSIPVDKKTGELLLEKKPQPPLQIIEYDAHAAENAAYHLAEEGMRKMEKFRETGNPWAFDANPNSNLCSKKWCPAWQTNFCDMGRPEKEKDDEE